MDDILLRWDFLALLAQESGLVSCGQIHVMWIDNLGLFLEVEGIFVALNVCLSELAIVVLLVVRIEGLGVGIAHKSISAASHSSALISRRQSLIWSRLPD